LRIIANKLLACATPSIVQSALKILCRLEHANTTLGLALSDGEMDYLVDNFTTLKRNPTDVELMMYAFYFFQPA
jgi:phosphoribosylformylglycinamidine (FGAM) synthase-like enzyme